MINFLHEAFRPKITCDKPCSDGYDISNLIQNETITNKGFYTEYFVRTPVCITVSFPFNVDIFRIVIDPVVGRLKSLGFQIFTQSKKSQDDLSFLNNSKPSSQFDGCSNESSSVNQHIGVSVGRIQLDEAAIVSFVNKRYKERRMFKGMTLKDGNDDVVSAELRHHLMKSLSDVSHVTIQITRTLRSCIPAIKLLEIWGQPSISCSRFVLEGVKKKHADIQRRKVRENSRLEEFDVTLPSNDSVESNTRESSSPGYSLNSVAIPEEFIDPITCEIMSLPFLLPSGKILDRTTLEKHVKTESSWGRRGNDPFTGIPFSAQSKPVLVTGLKTRIDQFLLENCEKLKDVPRTLGRQKSRLLPKSDDGELGKTCKGQYSVKDNSLIVNDDVRLLNNCTITTSNGRREMEINGTLSKGTTKHLLSDCKLPKVKRLKEDIKQESNRDMSRRSDNECKNGFLFSNNGLDRSLDSSLAIALAGLPSFTKTPSTSSSNRVSGYSCGECQRSELPLLYRLPCDHSLCRTCLLNCSNENVCPVCKLTYTKQDVVKLHD